MRLITKESACITKNMQEVQSSNCRRYCVAQMWVVSVILLLTTAVFSVSAEQIELSAASAARAHFTGDGLQVSNLYSKLLPFSIDSICNRSFGGFYIVDGDLFYASFSLCSIYYRSSLLACAQKSTNVY